MQLANLLNFLGAHLAEAILLGATFVSVLFRKSITSYLEGKIKFDFDKKLEELRDQFAQNSQKIDRLQSGAFAALSEHNGLVLSKKMEAYEELWEFLCSLDKWAGAASMHHMLNMSEVRERAKSDDKIRHFCDTMLAGSDIADFKLPNHCRIYVDEKIFSLISAYYFYHLGVISDLKSVSLGIDSSLMNEERLLDTFKDILPEFSEYLDKYKIPGIHNLIPELKKMILNGIRENIYSAHDAQGMVNRSLGVLEHYEQAEAPAMNAEKIPDDLRRKPVPGPDQ